MTTPTSRPFPSSKRLRATLAQIKHLKDLPEEVLKAMIESATLRHFDTGQVIYLEGEPAEYVYILERGWVKATRMTHEGREQGLHFLRPVEMFGDNAVFTQTTYPATTTALEATDVWMIPSDALLSLVKRFPDLALAIISILSERIVKYIELVEDLSLRSVDERLASTLLRNAELIEGEMVVVRRTWTTLDEMAVRLGTVRDVLSRAMKTLELEGYIKVDKQKIVIVDPAEL
ncbi:MAG TPA: Crp/Fnr family transcriptional regulator, partial [Anaerolineaceae bacterium]|nr:Crp/Fnr family transcriptional regulator [Anaerolineaceae bacterium]